MGGAELAGRDDLPVEELLIPRVITFRLFHGRQRALHLRLRLLHSLVLQRRIDAGEQLPPSYVLVEVGVDGRDLSRDLGSDLDRFHGTEGTGGGDGWLQAAALDGGGAIHRRFASVGPLVKPAATDEDDHADRGRGNLPECGKREEESGKRYFLSWHHVILRRSASETRRAVTSGG